jgi:hypothetical protein
MSHSILFALGRLYRDLAAFSAGIHLGHLAGDHHIDALLLEALL